MYNVGDMDLVSVIKDVSSTSQPSSSWSSLFVELSRHALSYRLPRVLAAFIVLTFIALSKPVEDPPPPTLTPRTGE